MVGVDGRGLSAPLGVVLMLAVVLGLGVAVASGVLAIGDEQSADAPSASISIDVDAGSDGTLEGSGGGTCGDYDGNDGIVVTHNSGEGIQFDNIAVRVGSTAVTDPCNMGDTDLEYYDIQAVTDNDGVFAAGTSITIREGPGNNAIRPGATVKVIWTGPDGNGQTLLSERELR